MFSDVKVAQVGCGHWGKNLVRNFAELGALVAIADGESATAERVSRAYGVPALRFEDILVDSAIDAVSLATPAVTHAEMALQALTAGKHVFVEKPLALDAAEAERVVAAADALGRVLMVGHLLNYHPLFLFLRRLVADGALGELRYVYSNRLSLGKFRIEENVLWSFSPHDLSMLLALVGEEPDHVAAEGAAYITQGVADWSLAQLRFPCGVRGHVQASWHHPFKEHRLVVVGNEAMAVFEDSHSAWDRRLALYRHSIECNGSVPAPISADPEYVDVPKAEPLRAECEHFLACIADGVSPLTDGREGLRVLRVLNRLEVALARSIRGEVA